MSRANSMILALSLAGVVGCTLIITQGDMPQLMSAANTGLPWCFIACSNSTTATQQQGAVITAASAPVSISKPITETITHSNDVGFGSDK